MSMWSSTTKKDTWDGRHQSKLSDAERLKEESEAVTNQTFSGKGEAASYKPKIKLNILLISGTIQNLD